MGRHLRPQAALAALAAGQLGFGGEVAEGGPGIAGGDPFEGAAGFFGAALDQMPGADAVAEGGTGDPSPPPISMSP